MMRFLLILCCLFPAVAAAQSEEELKAAEETHIPGLRFYPHDDALKKAGIQVVYVPRDVRPGEGKYACASQTPKQRNNAVEQLRAAFGRLAPDALERTDLRYVLLCSEARHSGRAIGGIPVPPLDMLMLSAGKEEMPSKRFQLTALHELYHYVEYKNELYTDHEWDHNFEGYMNHYGSTFPRTDVGSGGKDFINAYAQTYSHEDRAELFALMVMDPGSVLKQLRKSNSPVLALKIEFVVSRCREMLGYDACR